MQHGTISHAPPAYLTWILLFVSQGELAAAEVAAEAGERGDIDIEGGAATPRLMTVLQQSNQLIQVRALFARRSPAMLPTTYQGTSTASTIEQSPLRHLPTSGKKHQQSKEMAPLYTVLRGGGHRRCWRERGREWAVAAAAAPCTAEVAAGLALRRWA